jgi:hypothetical protein
MLSALVPEELLLAVSAPIVTRGLPHHTSRARESLRTIADGRCAVREPNLRQLARSQFLARCAWRDLLLECLGATGINAAPSATWWRGGSERGARLPLSD